MVMTDEEQWGQFYLFKHEWLRVCVF
jgi:hypothetical protein